MWHGNYGFNNGNPPNNASNPNNPNQNGFPVPPFSGPPGTEQQYNAGPQQFNQGPPGEGYLNFQPPNRPTNEQMYLHNQMTASPMAQVSSAIGSGPVCRESLCPRDVHSHSDFNSHANHPAHQFPPFPPTQFNMPQSISPSVMVPAPTMNARAAELKAQLLKRKHRLESQGAAAKMGQQTTKQNTGADQTNPPSQNTPNAPATSFEQEHNINELISQYSESTPTAAANLKPKADPQPPASHRPSAAQALAMPQGHSSGSFAKLEKLITNSSTANMVLKNKTPEATQTRNAAASASDMSEGEIPDDETPQKSALPPKPKESRASVPQNKARARISPTEQESITKNNKREALQNSLPYRPPSRTPSIAPSPTPSRMVGPDSSSSVFSRQEEPSSRQEKKAGADDKNNRAVRAVSDKQSHPEERSHDQNTEPRTPVVTAEQNQKESTRPAREERPPTLAQLLAHDRDLREWLEVTDYFNIPNREKILNRRRAIADLDEQRRKLVAEIEADERTPILLAPRLQYSVINPYVKNEEEAEHVPKAKPAEPKPQLHDRVVSNKRSYSSAHDQHDAGGPVKLQRIDGRPTTSGRDSTRRESTSYRAEPRAERPRFDDARGRGRSPSPVRGRSPYWRPEGSRSPSPRRMRSYDRLNESGYRLGKDKRPYEIHGGYRGRAFDPNYRRGRGSARGRGDFQGHFDTRTDSAYGPRVVNGRPFKDPRGFERGNKGGQ